MDLALQKAMECDENAVRAEAAAERAESSVGKISYVGENDNWYAWDEVAGKFVDTGKPSRGEIGPRGVSGVYVGAGDMPDGYNVQIDPNGDAPLPYYTPVITQPDTHTMRIDFAPSDDELPGVAPVELTLPDTASIKVKDGLTVAILGDSISTHPKMNAYEMVIEDADVGVELSSYITHYDAGKTISLDGKTSDYTITSEDVGTELTFIPCSSDVGKGLGEPLSYYKTPLDVWWKVASDALGFEPIVASWSGTSVTSHTSIENGRKCSYAWHRHTIRTLGKRIPGSMKRLAPDVVLIYRGTNDFSNAQYKVSLTNGYFDEAKWTYPSTDKVGDGTYGLKQGLALTIKRIRTAYPRARIVLCTCNVFKRSNYANFPTNNGRFNIPQMNAAIREVAEFFGCQTIDLDRCGITWENMYNEGYVTDNPDKPVHPNESGHALMGRQAISDLLHKLHIDDIDPSFDEVEDVAHDATDDGGNVQTKIGDLYGTLVDNSLIHYPDGEFQTGTTIYFTYTDVAVDENTTYKAPSVRNVAFYDSDGTYISMFSASGSLSGRKITTPDGAAKMTVTYKYEDFASPKSPADVTITLE